MKAEIESPELRVPANGRLASPPDPEELLGPIGSPYRMMVRSHEKLPETHVRCGGGLLLLEHRCSPPGWWARLWFHRAIGQGARWDCDCGNRWRLLMNRKLHKGWGGLEWVALKDDGSTG